jgi:multimeric flavodoxin WrbA
MKKVLIINCSLYGKRGQTEIILDWVREFFSGAQITSRYMSDDKIAPCRGCNSCINQARGKCQITDSMDLYRRYMSSNDLIIIGAPVYVNFFPSVLKSFFERLRPFNSGKYTINSSGNFAPVSLNNEKHSILVISTSGFPENHVFAPIKSFFNSLYSTYTNYEDMGGIYIPAFKTIREKKVETVSEIKKDVFKELNKVKSGKKAALCKEWINKEEFKYYLKEYGLYFEKTLD